MLKEDDMAMRFEQHQTVLVRRWCSYSSNTEQLRVLVSAKLEKHGVRSVTF